MGKVKGSILIPWIKGIRSDKSGVYKPWFTEADWKVIKSTVIPSAWYPFEVYRRCFEAVYNVWAKGNDEIMYMLGYENAKNIVQQYYSLVVKDSPSESVKAFSYMEGIFFGGGDFEDISAPTLVYGERRIQVHNNRFPIKIKGFYHMLCGWYAGILELGGAKDIKSEFISKSWEGDEDTIIEFTWS